MDDFMVLRDLMDISYGALGANTEKVFQAQSAEATPGTISTSNLGGGKVAEITELEVIPPVSATGAYEDLRYLSFVLDNHGYQHYIYIPGNGTHLMTPQSHQLRGGRSRKIRFGTPFWQLAMTGILGGGVSNMPLKNTTLKFGNQVQLVVSTKQGITAAGNANGKWRVIARGYTYTMEQLAYLGKGWKNSINYQTIRRSVTGKNPLSITNYSPTPSTSGYPIGMDNWTSLPGGHKQGAIKINPYWHFAKNALATDSNTRYVLSNLPEVGGSANNVEISYDDLGFNFAANLDAFICMGFGIAAIPNAAGDSPGLNLARAGWLVNGSEVPQQNGSTNGWFVTPGENRLNYGSLIKGQGVAYLNQQNMFDSIPSVSAELGEPFLFYGDQAAPFIGANGAAIPADAVATCYNGVLIERS